MLLAEPTAREVLLEEQVVSLTENNKQLQEEVDRLQQEKKVLRLKIDALARKLFGRSSEKLNPGQLQLLFDTLAQEALPAAAAQTAPEAPACDASADNTPAAPGPPPAPVRKKRSLAELIENLPSSCWTISKESTPAISAALRFHRPDTCGSRSRPCRMACHRRLRNHQTPRLHPRSF